MPYEDAFSSTARRQPKPKTSQSSTTDGAISGVTQLTGEQVNKLLSDSMGQSFGDASGAGKPREIIVTPVSSTDTSQGVRQLSSQEISDVESGKSKLYVTTKTPTTPTVNETAVALSGVPFSSKATKQVINPLLQNNKLQRAYEQDQLDRQGLYEYQTPYGSSYTYDIDKKVKTKKPNIRENEFGSYVKLEDYAFNPLAYNENINVSEYKPNSFSNKVAQEYKREFEGFSLLAIKTKQSIDKLSPLSKSENYTGVAKVKAKALNFGFTLTKNLAEQTIQRPSLPVELFVSGAGFRTLSASSIPLVRYATKAVGGYFLYEGGKEFVKNPKQFVEQNTLSFALMGLGAKVVSNPKLLAQEVFLQSRKFELGKLRKVTERGNLLDKPIESSIIVSEGSFLSPKQRLDISKKSGRFIEIETPAGQERIYNVASDLRSGYERPLYRRYRTIEQARNTVTGVAGAMGLDLASVSPFFKKGSKIRYEADALRYDTFADFGGNAFLSPTKEVVTNIQTGTIRNVLRSGKKTIYDVVEPNYKLTQEFRPKGQNVLVTSDLSSPLGTSFTRETLIRGKKFDISLGESVYGKSKMFSENLLSGDVQTFNTAIKLDLLPVKKGSYTFKFKNEFKDLNKVSGISNIINKGKEVNEIQIYQLPKETTVRKFQTRNFNLDPYLREIVKNNKNIQSQIKESKQNFNQQSGLGTIQVQKVALEQKNVPTVLSTEIKTRAKQETKSFTQLEQGKQQSYSSLFTKQEVKQLQENKPQKSQYKGMIYAVPKLTQINIQRQNNVQRQEQSNIQKQINRQTPILKQNNVQRQVNKQVQKNIQEQTQIQQQVQKQLQKQVQVQRQLQRQPPTTRTGITFGLMPSTTILSSRYKKQELKPRKYPKSSFKLNYKQNKGYQASAGAIISNIRGKPSKIDYTAFGIRPIPKKKRR